MKKAFFLVLLVPILTIGLISCDASIRSNIADFMGGFSGNVFVEAGLVEPNKADVQAAVATIATIGTAGNNDTVPEDTTNVTVFGLTGVDLSSVSSGATFLAPQTADKQTEVKTNLSKAIASTSQKEELLTSLKTTATAEQKLAAQGTVAVFNAAITSLSGSISDVNLKAAIDDLALPAIEELAEVTQADMLILQMMTDLVGNTIAAVTDSSDGSIDQDLINEEKALEIFGDALFVAKVTENLSGAASINFSADLITGLLGAVQNDRSSSRTTESGVWQDIENWFAEDSE